MIYRAPDTSVFQLVEFLNAVTGWNLSADAYFKTGKRILHLRKAFNDREGLRPWHARLPGRAVGTPHLAEGVLKGGSVDVDALEREFYEFVGWDLMTGGPTPAVLREMELDELFA